MLAAVSSAAAQSTSAGAPGVNPKDNITKGELFYRFDRLDGGASIQALAFKFDHAFNASVEANVEVPPIRLNTPGDDFSGLGDIALRVRHVRTAGPWSVIVAAEAALPTASRDKLGRGKWQLNPVAGGSTHSRQRPSLSWATSTLFSVADDDTRPDISDMQPRVLLARVWKRGYWALADLKYTKALKGDKSEWLDLEFEGGAMLAPDLGAWMRLGTSGMDSTRRWGVLFGLRRIW